MQLFSFVMGNRLRLKVLVMGMMAMCAMPLTATAQQAQQAQQASDSIKAFTQRYPAGSIKSVELANQALTDAAQERIKQEDQYIEEQHLCYTRFFVSSCLEDAKQANRMVVKQIREIEGAANAFNRQATVDERDKALAEQRILDEQDAIRRQQDQKEQAEATARKLAESAASVKEVKERERLTAGQADLRIKQQELKLREIEASEAAKAPERAANERAYQQKVKDAEAHRLEVEAKKAEKMRERAAKAAAATPVKPTVPATPAPVDPAQAK